MPAAWHRVVALRAFNTTGRNASAKFRLAPAEVAKMHARPGRPFAVVMETLGTVCAYAIIVGMLATALAPLFAPLFH